MQGYVVEIHNFQKRKNEFHRINTKMGEKIRLLKNEADDVIRKTAHVERKTVE